VLLGDGAVGKTSLRLRFMGHGFQSSYLSTIGADFSLKDVKTINPSTEQEINTKLQIWDLAGQQHYSKIRSNYYVGTHAAFIIFDVSRRTSFDNISNWVSELKKNSNQNIPIVIIANKIDLRADSNINFIYKEEGERIVEKLSEFENKVFYTETSAKSGEGVDEAFNLLINELFSVYERKWS
jgi:small GTP-binding protein